MSFPFKSTALFFIPTGLLIGALSFHEWDMRETPFETLSQTLKAERGFQLTELSNGYKTTEIAFYDPQTDINHRLLVCADDAPRGCISMHTQFRRHDPDLYPQVMTAGDSFSPAQKELTRYMTNAVTRSTRPHGLWKFVDAASRFIRGKGLH